MAVRIISTDDGDASGGDVDGNSQQLRSRCRVAQISDDGWQEEADPIERGNDTPVHWFQ